MKHTENAGTRPKRRVPTAALIAAVLVVVLAGTALAGEYLGFFRLKWLSGHQMPDGEEMNGYAVTLEDVRFPAEELSDEVFAIGEKISDPDWGWRRIDFDSWAECGEFLGVELADNPRLEHMQKDTCRVKVDENRYTAHAWVDLCYVNLLPARIGVSAYYKQGNNIMVNQNVTIRTQSDCYWEPDQWNYFVPQNGEETLEYEVYTMSSGIEALLVIDTYETGSRETPISVFDQCYASFIMDDMRYLLNVSVRCNPGDVPEVGALELAKEILDAYE